MRPVLSSIVLAVLATNPCFAKDGHSHGHALHGARAADNGAGGKGTSGNGASGTKGTTSAARKTDVPIDSETVVAPPVLPRGVTQRQIRITNPSTKTANRRPSSLNPASTTTMTAPTARNAVGQPVVSPRNFPAAEPLSPGLQKSGAVSPPIIHGGPTVPPVSTGTARVNVANNRGSVNGATVIRPANAPSAIGGPAQPRYGINGTTVQNKH